VRKLRLPWQAWRTPRVGGDAKGGGAIVERGRRR